MYAAARTALFALDPETAHELVLAGLRVLGNCPGAITPTVGQARRVMGLTFANPVGLAAGLDKDALAVLGLARLGFGFVEVGTVTPRPQSGNPKPRLFRLPAQRALINRMGFNNAGLAGMVPRLQRLRAGGRLRHTILGVNIGKNKATDNAQAGEDYLTAFAAVAQFADYVAINLSSPNTPGLRALQSAQALAQLLGPLKELQQQLAQREGKYTPLAVKVAPDLLADEAAAIAAQLLAFEVDGLIATNTTLHREGLTGAHAREAGGLSGLPLTALAEATVRLFAAELGGRIPIIGVGGVQDVASAQALLAAGASLIQIYTGFIYEGPGLVRALARI